MGHLWSAVRHDPASPEGRRQELRRTVETEDHGDMILRRTTIEEVELRRPERAPPEDAQRPPEGPAP